MTVTLSILDPVRHPGPRVEPRIISVATTSRAIWANLPAGKRLIDALDALLASMGTSAAQVELLSGTFTEVAYCYPAIGATEEQPIHYSAPQSAAGPVAVVGGCATVGYRDAERFSHCHAAWFDADGQLRGGHLLPDTWVGPAGVSVVVHTLDDAVQHSATDPESRLPVFTPTADSEPADAPRAVISRICPNENLFDACARVMRAHGLRDARIVGTLGSLIGAALHRQSGVLLIDGPATEVALSGRLTLDESGGMDGQLSAVVIDRHGRVHMGDLTRDNLVAVTVELFIEDCS